MKRTIIIVCLVVLLAICLVLLIAPPCYDAWARRRLREYVSTAQREPAGNILRGGAPVHIDRGRQRACLLLHGFMGTPADVGELPQALDGAGWDVHAPLLPGHGTDPRDLEGLTADDIITGAEAELIALRGRYPQVVVVGFSLGGAIALILSERHDAAGLVLINPFFKSTYRLCYVLPPRCWYALLTPLVDYVVRPPGIVNVNRREARVHIIAYKVVPSGAFGEAFEIADRAASSQPRDVPLLMLLSEGDCTASPSAARRIYDRVSTARTELKTFHRSNHLLLWDYDREEATEAVLVLMRGLAAR
jgi:carboxylesterase